MPAIDEERDALETGCEDDPCDESCGEFQVRRSYEKKASS